MDDPRTIPHRLPLEGNLTIYEAPALKAQLMAAVAEGRHLELDLAQVGEIDTSGVQLLLLAKREAAARGLNLGLVNHSAAVREVLDFLNLVGYFGDPLVIPADPL